MERTMRWFGSHHGLLRGAWLAIFLVLAACNNSDGGGGPGY